jgi:hypothetical protein
MKINLETPQEKGAFFVNFTHVRVGDARLYSQGEFGETHTTS